MTLYIKHMVSIPCKMVVKGELEKHGLHFDTVELGYVEVAEDPTPEQRRQLKEALSAFGLELIDDKKSILIEKIKHVIIDTVQNCDEPLKTNFSAYLCEKLNYDYRYMSNLFASAMGVTIENYLIIHKIEKVKELLMYENLNLSEISYKLNYSSVAHLSNQFKKYTGLTPSFFKNLQKTREKATF